MINELEKLGIKLGTLALGVEHFAKGVRKSHLSRDENSKLLLEEAINLGITHFDLIFNLPYFFDTFSEVISKRRDEITFSTHLGTIYDPKFDKLKHSRSVPKIKATFEDLLERLNTDYTDIAMIQYIRNKKDFDKIVQKNGLLDYTLNLKKEGVTRAVGISWHNYDLLSELIDKIPIDVVMTIMNFATGNSSSLKRLILDPEKAKAILTDLGYDLEGDDGLIGSESWITLLSTICMLFCLVMQQKRRKKMF